MKLFLDKIGVVRPGVRILHFAPERGLSEFFQQVQGVQYDAYDLFPEQYAFASATKFDLAAEAADLPGNYYDLVVHSHVIEHVPCNYTAVLLHLHRALRPGGFHIFCVPILGGKYEECIGSMSDEERVSRFGQSDHVRKFGVSDIHLSLGMIFPLPDSYDLDDHFSNEVLNGANVPEQARRGFSSSSVFSFRKDEIKL